ncbi:3-isopropylmalate dehydratase [Purpureocillium lavendulum]|uniref:3-isopropylmalate dehydratase n=1 Tax=Purpureocillium lavendulum TaxID=1247861 RepID=A0AB34G1C4_9HYPO|nr:3-isopropylmalate dehydratase [Purpureocillium lavendulum]
MPRMRLVDRLVAAFGDPVEDPDEETFLLYSRPMASLDLGFVDRRAASIEVPVRGHNYTIHQSPSVLASSRAGGTTGAVLWRVTPLFASWLATPLAQGNPILSLLRPRPSVVELGCGISPLCALALRPLVSSYLLTDQPYVQRLITQNLAANPPPRVPTSSAQKPPSASSSRRAHRGGGGGAGAAEQYGDVRFRPLDWETDQVTADLASPHGGCFDALVACDCVYNYALVEPFVQTCADVCALRAAAAAASRLPSDIGGSSRREGAAGDEDAAQAAGAEDPCLCVVAQQLRNDDVFLEWLRAFSDKFRVWRVPEHVLPEGLRPGDGFVVHLAALAIAAQIAGAIEPGRLLRHLALKGSDLVLELHRQADVVEAVHQAVLAELLHVEAADGVANRVLDDLRRQVHLDVAPGAGLIGDGLEIGLVLDPDGQHAVLERVVEEDVGKRRRDDALDTKVKQRPGGVLAGAAATKVVARADEDLGAAVRLLVQHELGVLGAVRIVAQGVEQCGAKAGALDGLEELLWDDGVRVHIGHLEGRGDALEGAEFGQACRGSRVRGVHVGLRRRVFGLVADHLPLVSVLVDPLVDVGGSRRRDPRLDMGAGAVVGQLADVGKLANNAGGGGHDRGHEMRATLGTLAALEVAVRRTGAALLGRQDVGVHAQAHAAAGLSPFEASIKEDLVESLFLGLGLDQARAGDDHGALDVRRDPTALDDVGGGAQVLNARVGAGADEDLVDGNVLHGSASSQAHVFEHAPTSRLLGLAAKCLRVGDDAGNGDNVLRAGTPGHGGDDVLGVDEDVDVGPALEVLKGGFIGGDHAGTGSALDGHVADGHAGFHAKGSDDRTAKLDDGAGTASGANLANGVEDDVLGADAGGQLAVDLDAHVLGALGDEALGGKDVLDLAGANAKGQSAERAMGRGVAVAADNRGAGQGEALLGADNVDNALALVAEAEVGEAKVLDVLLEGDALGARVVFIDERGNVLQSFAGRGRHILQHASVSVNGTGQLTGQETGSSRIRTWSVVARVQSGLRTLRPAFLRPSKACYRGGQQ